MSKEGGHSLRGMTCFLDVLIRYASYYSEIQVALMELEALVRPPDQVPPIAANSSLPLTLRTLPNDIWVGATFQNPQNIVMTRLLSRLNTIQTESAQLELKRTKDRVRRIFDSLGAHPLDDRGDERMVNELKVLREAFDDDLRERLVFIPSIEQSEYYNKEMLFGESVYNAFPSSRLDILEAGNCYATDNFTASIFHLMRVGELGLRALAMHLKIKKIGKIGKQKTPIEYADWGTVSRALKSKLDGLQQKNRGARKSIYLKRYADAASQADFLNDIWRKDVSHTRGQYNQPEALNALLRVREFMQSLSGWLQEPKRKDDGA